MAEPIQMMLKGFTEYPMPQGGLFNPDDPPAWAAQWLLQPVETFYRIRPSPCKKQDIGFLFSG
jgi:hypothetical protein